MNSQQEKPMTSIGAPAFYVLYALADRPRHGYGILLEVEERTDGEVRMGTSTLYTTIQRLLKDDLMEGCPSPHPGQDDPRRRYYRLTEQGRQALQAEAARLDSLARLVREKRILPISSQ